MSEPKDAPKQRAVEDLFPVITATLLLKSRNVLTVTAPFDFNLTNEDGRKLALSALITISRCKDCGNFQTFLTVVPHPECPAVAQIYTGHRTKAHNAPKRPAVAKHVTKADVAEMYRLVLDTIEVAQDGTVKTLNDQVRRNIAKAAKATPRSNGEMLN